MDAWVRDVMYMQEISIIRDEGATADKEAQDLYTSLVHG